MHDYLCNYSISYSLINLKVGAMKVHIKSSSTNKDTIFCDHIALYLFTLEFLKDVTLKAIKLLLK